MITPFLRPEPGAPANGLPGFSHQFIHSDGVAIHYVVGGAGRPILLLHGWPFTWIEFRPLMSLLADAGYLVIAPDMRGMGDTDKPDRPCTKHQVAEDTLRILREHSDEAAHVVGTDLGMMVAFRLALIQPDTVRRLVLSEGLLPGFGLEESMDVARGGYWHFGFHAQVDVAGLLISGKEEEYLGRWWRRLGGADGSTVTAELRAKHTEAGAVRGGLRHYESLLQDGRDNRAHFTTPLPMPVLVLNGERGIPQERTLSSVQQAAANVRADVAPDAGHTIANDNPHWLANRLTRFFTTAE